MIHHNTIVVAGMFAALASMACTTARAQSVPDVGERGAVSSVQATACVPPSPVNDRYNHCGWGVWRLETQRTAVIATLAEAANYLICREMVDAAEPGGYPISVEADGVVISTGTPAMAAGHAPGGCFLVSGKKIVINGAARPQKPVGGYYIRLGALPWSNAVSWQARKLAAATADRTLLARFPQQRLLRVCFGNYSVLGNPPPYLRDFRLWADNGHVVVRGSEVAVFNFGSCTDVSASLLAVEPQWAGGIEASHGRLVF
ncbi:hypothetical protein [Lysobacter brunescens]|uniref:Phosphodiester glycosidase domain-containing protein n=1 Tax=Lysobacter brunescens TaxID=262323 RepID=A0ABW2Y7M1_9GAMM